MTLKQERTPIFSGILNYIEEGTIPFHVPGHKQGRGLQELKDFVGEKVLQMDLTCFEGTDNICNPLNEIKEAQALAAEAYGADHAFFLVNGTTSGIQAMIMSVCQPGDKIIVPRNAHKSAIGGIILSGAVPVYIQPEISEDHGVALAVTSETVAKALALHPDAKGLFIINPTYYGFTADLQEIVRLAHSYDIPVLVDEAHGAHLPFHEDLPLSAMACGADMSATSTHKMGGSLTQSSVLFVKEGLIDPKRVKAVLNLTQTTSPSYILLASIDLARKQMFFKGHEILQRTLELTDQLRSELSDIPGIKVIGDEMLDLPGCYSWDRTKVAINVKSLGYSGFDVENILRKDYKIQVELADLYNVLFLLSIGDNEETIKTLIRALKEIAKGRYLDKVTRIGASLPETPEQLVSPQEAFYSETKLVSLEEAEGEISAEMIMAYPPGIPILCPGERITKDIIEYVRVLKNEFCHLQGPEDPHINQLKVLVRHLVLVKSAAGSGNLG